MRVRIDTGLCTGHGRCYTLAPEVFESDNHGYGFVTRDDVPDELCSQALIGIQNCPERAISIEDPSQPLL
jgi:ferredoxin